MEHYITITAGDIAPEVLKPDRDDVPVRVHTDGFVTLEDTQELFAAMEGWGGYYDSAEELSRLAYILKEIPQTEVTEDGVDCFVVVEYGRIRSFLRSPEEPDSEVFLYANGMVSLAPEDVVFAQVRDWEEENIWRLEQMAARLGVEIQTREEEEEPLSFEAANAEEEPPEFW